MINSNIFNFITAKSKQAVINIGSNGSARAAYRYSKALVSELI
jgi:hypothetical protein